MRLAVIGKGGAGKSVITGTIARLLARRGRQVLALDSDTMPGLARSLGVEDCAGPPLKDAAERVEGSGWRLKEGIDAETVINRYAREAPDGVLLLQLGKWDAEASKDRRSFQASTQAYWRVVHWMLEPETFRDWVLVGDTPAGPRHVAGNFTPFADTYLVIVESGWQSVLAARRVTRIARMLEGRILPVANKVQDESDIGLIEERLGEPVFAQIPFDPEVSEAERLGVPLIEHAPDSAAVHAIERLIEALEAAPAAKTG